MDVKERERLVIGLTWRYCASLADAGMLEGAILLSASLCKDWPPCVGDAQCAGCGRPRGAVHEPWCACDTNGKEARELAELAALWGNERDEFT